MANKAELLEQAKEKGLDVKSSTTKAELESMLAESGSDTPETGTASGTGALPSVVDATSENTNNPNGEKTNGTTKDGSEEPVTNETAVPQNGDTEVSTLDVTDNPVAKRADESRTEEEVTFADEANPNQKRRDGGAPGEEYDQDGNPRTGGYSYGVSADDTANTVPNEENKGEAPEEDSEVARVQNEAVEVGSFINTDTNHAEWSIEDQQKLEDSLSDREAGIQARVTTSAGDYVRVKFFHNNKPLGTYTSRKFDEGEAKSFLSELRKDRDV